MEKRPKKRIFFGGEKNVEDLLHRSKSGIVNEFDCDRISREREREYRFTTIRNGRRSSSRNLESHYLIVSLRFIGSIEEKDRLFIKWTINLYGSGSEREYINWTRPGIC